MRIRMSAPTVGRTHGPILGLFAIAIASTSILAANRVSHSLPDTPVVAHAQLASDNDRSFGGLWFDDGRHGSVWVVNRDQGELTVFDAATGRVVKQLNVGAGAHDICVSERTGKAYITAESIDTVTSVDVRTFATESITVSPLPHHIEPSADGRLIYVTLASHTTTIGAPELAIIDTRNNSVRYVASSNNPAARSHGPHPAYWGDTVYVSHDTGNEVTGVDLGTGAIDPSIAPILRAEEVKPSLFRRLLWVTSRGDGTLKRIDLRTNTITGSVAVGTQPESIMLTPSERTAITSLRGSPATLAFVDTASLTLLGSVPIAGSGTFGDLAVITDNGRYVYATFDGGTAPTAIGGVAVVDVRKRELVASWPYPATGRPHGIWYSRLKYRDGK